MTLPSIFKWIELQKENTIEMVQHWAEINSWTENTKGLNQMIEALEEAFSPLQGTITRHSLPSWNRIDAKGHQYEVPLGQAIHISKRSDAAKKVLLGGHMDTVYPPHSPFQKVRRTDTSLIGPGVADMKGGLAVLWLVLAALEKHHAHELGWEVLITPDEEVGSPGSKPLWEACAKRVNIGLLFEPAFPDGSVVDARKGSTSFSVLIKGKSAHVGRAFHEGKNAVKGLAEFIHEAYSLADSFPDTTLNMAHLYGGDALNIVPDLASCKGNLRSFNEKHLRDYFDALKKLAAKIGKEDSLEIQIQIDQQKLPKPFEGKTVELFSAFDQNAKNLGIPLTHRTSGGLCDGNILQAAGLPTIDSLGVIGGNLHTHDEYMQIDSLVERAKLTCSFLYQYGKE